MRPGALTPPQPLGARAPRDQTGAAEGGNASLTPPPRPGWFRSLEPALRPVRRWLAGRGGSASHSRGPVSLAVLTMRVEAWGPEAGTLWGDRGTHTAICPRGGSRGDTRRPDNHGWKLPLHPGEWATLAPPRPHHAPTTPARLKFCSRGFAATVSPARSAFGSSASWAAVTRPPPSDTAAPTPVFSCGPVSVAPAPRRPHLFLPSPSLCPLISLPWSPSLPSLVPFCLFPPAKSLCSLSLASLWL